MKIEYYAPKIVICYFIWFIY